MLSKYPPLHVVLTGVCGTSTSSIASRLSELTDIPVSDADDFHPATNQRKLATGQELGTADLTPWLHRLRDWIADRAMSGASAILTCPPLTREDRDILREAEDISTFTGHEANQLLIIQLTAPRDILAERLLNDPDHLVPLSVLDTQIDALEPLAEDEFGTIVDASGPPEDVADAVLNAITSLRAEQMSPTQS